MCALLGADLNRMRKSARLFIIINTGIGYISKQCCILEHTLSKGIYCSIGFALTI
jgi:hypothetical protein